MRMKRLLGLLLVICVVVAGLNAQTTIYVKLTDNASQKAFLNVKNGTMVRLADLPIKKEVLKKFALSPEAVSIGISSKRSTAGIFRIRCYDKDKVEELIEALNADPNVEYAEKAPVYKILKQTAENVVMNDPYYVNAVVRDLNLRWHLDMVNAEEAWTIAKGKPSVKVAVIDNAVWGAHEDLLIDTNNQYNAIMGISCSTPVGIDNTIDCTQEEYYSGECAAYNWSHGTHVAGLVGAINNNGKGIASVGGGITLMGVHCGINDGEDISNVAEGVAWAVEHGAKIINLSFGSPDTSRIEKEIITAAAEQGVIFVAAAGNDGVKTVMYPAGYECVIAVGSNDYSGEISKFSNYGGWVDVLAPGGYGPNARQDYIFSSTFSKSQDLRDWGYHEFDSVYYDRMIGTSMASPLTASVVALMVSQDSTLNHHDVRSILMETAQPSLTSGIAENSGIVDAAAAVKAIATYEKLYRPACLTAFSIEKIPGNRVPILRWTVDGLAQKPTSLRLYRDNLLLQDNISPDVMLFHDSTAHGGASHCYEICEVNAQGKESYRLRALLMMPAQCKLTLKASPAEGGEVFGGGIYEAGSTVILQAKANPGYKFDQWSLNGIYFSVKDSLSAILETSAVLLAEFIQLVANEDGGQPAGFQVFPNPASTSFSLRGLENNQINRVELYSLDGCLRKRWEYNESTQFAIGDLPAGIYTVAVFGNKSRFTTKLLKR